MKNYTIFRLSITKYTVTRDEHTMNYFENNKLINMIPYLNRRHLKYEYCIRLFE